jgi:hypothetical protein
LVDSKANVRVKKSGFWLVELLGDAAGDRQGEGVVGEGIALLVNGRITFPTKTIIYTDKKLPGLGLVNSHDAPICDLPVGGQDEPVGAEAERRPVGLGG